MPGIPKITVTMLGGTGSGKTTYLHGLYATLSAGLDGYFLTAEHNLDLDLSEAWDALVEDGELPPPTSDVPKAYSLTFKDGFTPLINVDWLDYRGGAMSDRTDAADAAELVRRLESSDSIYLTVDGGELVGGLERRDPENVLRATRVRRMTTHVQRAVEKRGGFLPSLVVLITKADLIAAGAADSSELLDRAVADVQKLLPVAFQCGVTTLVCPVSLGNLGYAQAGRVDAEMVAPRWMHKPMIFSLVRFLELNKQRAAEIMQTEEEKHREFERELERIDHQLLRPGKKADKRRLTLQMDESWQRREQGRTEHEWTESRLVRLVRELEQVPRFVDGRRVS